MLLNQHGANSIPMHLQPPRDSQTYNTAPDDSMGEIRIPGRGNAELTACCGGGQLAKRRGKMMHRDNHAVL